MSSPGSLAPADAAAQAEAEARVVGKAAVRAAQHLGLSNAALARVLGLSEASASRLQTGDYLLVRKHFELAVLFIRLFRGLDAIVGGDAESARSWLCTHNLALRGKPLALIQTVHGLAEAVQYVDAQRARV